MVPTGEIGPDGKEIKTVESFRLQKIETLTAGPVKAAVRVTSTYRDPDRHDTDPESQLVIDYSLYRGTGRVEMDVQLDWYEKHKMLKFQIPLALESRQTSAEGVLDTEIRNENGDEWATRNYIEVSGRRRDTYKYAGFTLANNGAPSYSMDNRNLYVSLVRSPDTDTHDPATNAEDTPHSHTDQGRHFLRYAFQTHPGDLEQGKALRFAKTFNQLSYVELQTANPDGTLPPEQSHFSTTKPNVFIDSIRIAENKNPDGTASDDAVIVVRETDGRQTSDRIHFFGRDIPVTLAPGEMKTLRIRKNGLTFDSNKPDLIEA
jgi:alpha-mannosidase